MQDTALMQQAADQITRLTERVRREDLDKPTPCTEWKVRDLLGHIATGGQMFARIFEEGSMSNEELGRLMSQDNLGDDYKASVRRSVDAFMAAVSAPGALEKTVTMPFGDMPATAALNLLTFDVTTHCADLARATGQQVDDTVLVEGALGIGKQMVGPAFRQPGFFDPEQPVAADAPAVDRLLAFAGRKI